MAVTTHRTFCRFCHANCAMLADVEHGKVLAVRGDPDDPEYGGYTCLKGRTLPESHNAEHRLHHSLMRGGDGAFRETPMPMALDHVAGELRRIIDEHGPDSVAVFMGSGGYQNSAAWAASHSFAQAVGSKHFFTSVTLDQPAKVFTTARYGKWEGGVNNFSDADVALFIGNNPIVSHYAPVGGVPPFSPSRRIRDRKAAGMKLIVADPRLAEVGQLADIYLPVKPGEDPALLAGMLNVIFAEELYDRNFAAAQIDGVAELREAVAPFTPEVAATARGRAGRRPDRRRSDVRGRLAGLRGHRHRAGDGGQRHADRISGHLPQHAVRALQAGGGEVRRARRVHHAAAAAPRASGRAGADVRRAGNGALALPRASASSAWRCRAT